MTMTTPQSPTSILPVESASTATISGLTSDEARRRLEQCGLNAMPDTALHPLRRAFGKFWALVPWMLEVTVVLQIVLGDYAEAAIIAGLLVFNAVLGLLQESHAQATLAALKSRLALNASVRRDGGHARSGTTWGAIHESGEGQGGTGKRGEGPGVRGSTPRSTATQFHKVQDIGGNG
jgi:hypothetical protein